MGFLDKLKGLFKRNKNKSVTALELDNMQADIDSLYASEGLTDSVLDKQVELNRLRNELNIPDESNFVYEDFVQ